MKFLRKIGHFSSKYWRCQSWGLATRWRCRPAACPHLASSGWRWPSANRQPEPFFGPISPAFGDFASFQKHCSARGIGDVASRYFHAGSPHPKPVSLTGIHCLGSASCWVWVATAHPTWRPCQPRLRPAAAPVSHTPAAEMRRQRAAEPRCCRLVPRRRRKRQTAATRPASPRCASSSPLPWTWTASCKSGAGRITRLGWALPASPPTPGAWLGCSPVAAVTGEPPPCPLWCSRECNHEFAGASASAPDVPQGVKKGSFMITTNRKKVRLCAGFGAVRRYALPRHVWAARLCLTVLAWSSACC